ncbi:hypothetical protein Glove_117g319 [Diversispora epigaea]|uniref:Uncharacterized protein n=1 Tax=Diversispora epigaea TaxID=1348612 RepID=A0A397J0B4_9GLOM|nr:hypothetical protein Glove_117g319 [Diversispora epigaea]
MENEKKWSRSSGLPTSYFRIYNVSHDCGFVGSSFFGNQWNRHLNRRTDEFNHDRGFVGSSFFGNQWNRHLNRRTDEFKVVIVGLWVLLSLEISGIVTLTDSRNRGFVDSSFLEISGIVTLIDARTNLKISGIVPLTDSRDRGFVGSFFGNQWNRHLNRRTDKLSRNCGFFFLGISRIVILTNEFAVMIVGFLPWNRQNYPF